MRASIIIPAYNSAETLPETLESIVSQLTPSEEVIVIDDGSTDDTRGVVQPYLDENVIYVWQPNSGGPASPRNHGIKIARGKYIILFDSDDLMLPGKIEASISALETNPESAMLFTNFQAIDNSGEIVNDNFLKHYETLWQIKHKKLSPTLRQISGEDLLHGLSIANFVGTSSVVVQKSALEIVGEFDESVNNGDDFNMWARLSTNFSSLYLDSIYHQYRIHPNSISKSNPVKRLKNLVKLHLKHTSEDFPEFFREACRKKVARYSYIISKLSLKSGNSKECRKYAKLALKYSERRAKPFILLAFSSTAPVTSKVYNYLSKI